MKIETALNHRDRAVSATIDAFNTAKICHQYHDELLTMLAKVRAPIEHCPGWVKEYVQGYAACMNRMLYVHDLEYCTILPDGRIVSHDSKSPRYYEKQGMTPRELHEVKGGRSGHFWKGTDKFFYTG